MCIHTGFSDRYVYELGMVAHACNPSTLEVEAGGSLQV